MSTFAEYIRGSWFHYIKNSFVPGVREAPRHHGITPEQVRRFKPDVCCDHAWIPAEDFCNPEAPGLFQCGACGATCTRAKDGTIEEYEARAPC